MAELSRDDVLPCDVLVAPGTIIRAGCKVSTLLLCLGNRVGREIAKLGPRGEVRAPQAVSVPEWLPIETAPTNGLSVLVWQPWESGRNCILIGYYANGWVDQAHRELEPRPTYWQPLPAAPAAATREGKE